MLKSYHEGDKMDAFATRIELDYTILSMFQSLNFNQGSKTVTDFLKNSRNKQEFFVLKNFFCQQQGETEEEYVVRLFQNSGMTRLALAFYKKLSRIITLEHEMDIYICQKNIVVLQKFLEARYLVRCVSCKKLMVTSSLDDCPECKELFCRKCMNK